MEGFDAIEVLNRDLGKEHMISCGSFSRGDHVAPVLGSGRSDSIRLRA